MTNPLYEALLEPHLESEKTFLLHDDGSKTSYCEFLELASRLAYQLRELGIKPDERIMVQVSKRLETLALYAASILTGTVYLPLNVSYTLNETEYFIKDALPSFILCEDSLVKDLEVFATNIGAKILTLNNDGSGTLQNDLDFFPNKFNVTERTSDSLAALLYTSGTTGQSKGAMLTQQNLLSNATSLTEFWEITNRDILIPNGQFNCATRQKLQRIIGLQDVRLNDFQPDEQIGFDELREGKSVSNYSYMDINNYKNKR